MKKNCLKINYVDIAHMMITVLRTEEIIAVRWLISELILLMGC